MTTIAIEEHVFPQELAAAVDAAGGRKPAFPPDATKALDDYADGGRIAAMDRAGIDLQVLSTVADALQQLDPAPAVALAQRANDLMAQAVSAHPDRLRAFAAIPTADPAAAAIELHRAVTELGFVGGMVFGTTRGRFLDDPAYQPVLEAFCDLDVPLYLHPAPPPDAVKAVYFAGLSDPVAYSLSTAAWGWHAETGLHVLRMAAAGTLERHRSLRVVVGHMGENLPFSLARADQRLSGVTGLERTITETVLEQVWITTCGYTTVPPLLCALQVFGADRMLFSVDYPFSDNVEGTTFIRNAPISPDDLEKISHLNAERLLRLGS